MSEPTSEQAPDDERPAPIGAAERPYIKQMPNRRLYDLQLLVPFLCIGASIGTVVLNFKPLWLVALLFAFGALYCWIRAGVVTTKSAHERWLLGMWGAVAVFLACGLLSRLTP